jgi:hypothetical protein
MLRGFELQPKCGTAAAQPGASKPRVFKRLELVIKRTAGNGSHRRVNHCGVQHLNIEGRFGGHRRDWM